jgi:hypothetical protein
MPTEVVAIGREHAFAQTTAYAMPARPCRVHSTVALDFSPNNSTWTTVTATTTGTDFASGFVRCTIATNCVGVFKTY